MKLLFIAASAALLALVTSAQAAKVVVMSVQTNSDNSAIPAGDQLVTFGIQVSTADLVNAGTNPVMVVQNLAFLGNGVDSGPIQSPISKGMPGGSRDVQNVQTQYIDSQLNYPPTNAQLGAVGAAQLYGDSWWYNSNIAVSDTEFGGTGQSASAGVLWGYNNLAGTTQGIVTTNPDTTLGAPGGTSAVGTTGYVWQSFATGIVGGNANYATMAFTGEFGPRGFNRFDAAPLAQQFHGGLLTVPLAQIVTAGDIYIPGDSRHSGGDYSLAASGPVAGPTGPLGVGTFIVLVGSGGTSGPTLNGTYNVAGGSSLVDPGLYYSFAQQALVPEPASLALAASGILALLSARRQRRHC